MGQFGLRIGTLLLLGPLLAWSAAAPPADRRVEVSITDQTTHARAGVRVRLSRNGAIEVSGESDARGRLAFTRLAPDRYQLSADQAGFQPVTKVDVDLTHTESASIDIVLVPAEVRRESLEVHDEATPVEQSAAPPESVAPADARELPGRPATVADVLPLVPGVVRAPGGGLKISASGEHRSALIVNSADVTDPATGQFGLTVPIDSVESINVYQSPFLAEYGRFTAGLVSVETRRGGDKWKWELNDPFPDFFIRSYQVRGVRDATPRLNLEGPIVAGKLYFSEGFEYAIRKTPVFTLPFPNNEQKQQGVNSFAQLDWIVSDRQLVTATMHAAPQRMDRINLSFFNPGPTTPSASTQNYTGTLADRLTLGSGLLENTVSVTHFGAQVWGQGPLDLTLTPEGASGNYFAQQGREASRASWLSNYSFPAFSALGTHSFKAGVYVARSDENGRISENPVRLLDSTGQLLEQIAFSAGQPFQLADSEFAFFGQDHWNLGPRLAADLGLRMEWQELTETARLAPRAGLAWNLAPKIGTVIRAGFGLFYDRVPLNVYSFRDYPSQTLTLYDGSGQIQAPPIVYQNLLGEVVTRTPFVFREAVAGNFSPSSSTWNVQLEQPLGPRVRLRASYLRNSSSGLVVLNPVAPTPGSGSNAPGSAALLLLTGSGLSQYHQFEILARVRLANERQLFFSYVHSTARGDLNDFANYLGSFPAPIIRPNQYGTLPADLPHRFLAWGVLKLPRGFRIAPLVEYRAGFPYTVTDALQNYVGSPNSARFPNFLSVDARVSKDFQVSPRYKIRFSISAYNLTDHFNPEALHTNIADPAFGQYFGQRGRHFTADFDFIF